MDLFVLTEDGILNYLGRRRESKAMMDEDLKLRLIVPTTLTDEILHNCHDSVKVGHKGIVRTVHRVKHDYYYTKIYAGVTKHIQACEDCSNSKITPHLRENLPGNVVSDRPF